MDIFDKDKDNGFNILSGNSTSGHGGFGVGTINLDSISPVIIDAEEKTAEVDLGAMHARSKVERRIRFSTDREKSAGGKLYWLVWLMTNRNDDGAFYAGAGACELVVNRETRRGYKVLPDHVNKMDKALKGKVMLDDMDAESKQVFKKFLVDYDEGMWERANPDLKKALEE